MGVQLLKRINISIILLTGPLITWLIDLVGFKLYCHKFLKDFSTFHTLHDWILAVRQNRSNFNFVRGELELLLPRTSFNRLFEFIPSLHITYMYSTTVSQSIQKLADDVIIVCVRQAPSHPLSKSLRTCKALQLAILVVMNLLYEMTAQLVN